jgi:hypothetical protein
MEMETVGHLINMYSSGFYKCISSTTESCTVDAFSLTGVA